MPLSRFARDAEDQVRRAILTWSCRNFSRCAVPVAALGDRIGSEILIRGFFEAHTLRHLATLLELNPYFVDGRIALDIGANIGNHAIFLSRIFERVYAFEPNPITFNILCANILMTESAIEPVALGLSSADGATEIAFSGADLGGASLAVRPSSARRLPVKLTTLDGWLARNALPPGSIGFIKIDVEEYECDVLKGAQAALRASDALIAFETAPNTSPAALAALLRDAGYRHFYEIQKCANSANALVRGFEVLRYGAERNTIESAIDTSAYREMALASKRPLELPRAL